MEREADERVIKDDSAREIYVKDAQIFDEEVEQSCALFSRVDGLNVFLFRVDQINYVFCVLCAAGCEGYDLIDIYEMLEEEFDEWSFVYVYLAALGIYEHRIRFTFIQYILASENHRLIQVEYQRWLI